jgi:hypothetical protein
MVAAHGKCLLPSFLEWYCVELFAEGVREP